MSSPRERKTLINSLSNQACDGQKGMGKVRTSQL